MSDLEVRASDAERDRAVVRLREAAAEGRLTLEEFTDRMHSAYETKTRAELETLVRDLPAERPAAAPLPEPSRRTARRWIVCVMGNSVRRGRWRVAERAVSVTLMGNSVIDLRHAELSAAEVTISVFNTMGNTRVIVPKGVDVDLSAIAIMGNRQDHTHGGSGGIGAPLVRVTGLIVMGNLFVQNR